MSGYHARSHLTGKIEHKKSYPVKSANSMYVEFKSSAASCLATTFAMRLSSWSRYSRTNAVRTTKN